MPTSSSELAVFGLRRCCPVCSSVFRQALAHCPRDGAPLTALTDDPLVGKLLAGRYAIERCIGEGGMGRVYLAGHETLPRPFAIKVLFGDLAADETMQARFRAEAAAAARLNHPNIAAITDFGEDDDGLLYIAMEYVEGESIHQLVRRAAPLDCERVVELLTQIAAGLDHAHRRGLVHRDLKSDNILVTTDGDEEVIKIVDFGIALAVDPDAGTRLTRDGVVVGTPDVMSPEQLTGEPIDHRADLFALGVVGFEMLAGKVPFDGPAIEVARQNLGVTAPSIARRSGRQDVPAALEAVIARLMAKYADDRYQSAKEVTAALADIHGQPAPPAAPFGSDERSIGNDPTVHMPGRRRRLSRLIAAIAALVALAVVVLVVREIRANRPTPASSPAPRAAPATPARGKAPPDLQTAPAAAASMKTADAGVASAATDIDAAPVAAADESPKKPRGESAGRAAEKATAKEAKATAKESKATTEEIKPTPKEKEDIYESRY